MAACDNLYTVAKIGRNQPCPCGSGKKYKRCCANGGARAKGIRIKLPMPAERIHAAVIDQERERAVFISNDFVTNTLQRDLPMIATAFDELCAAQIKEIDHAAAKLYSRFAEIVIRAPLSNSDLFRTLWNLVNNAATTTVAQIALIRSGFRLQPGSLARSTVELLCVVCHLALHPEDIKKFHEGKLSSTKTLAAAKEVLPPIGIVYGQLSEHFVHISHLHTGMNPVLPYEAKDASLDVNIMQVKLCLWLVLVITELAFFPWLSEPRYWQSMGGAAYKYHPDDEEHAWMRTFLRGAFEDLEDENQIKKENPPPS